MFSIFCHIIEFLNFASFLVQKISFCLLQHNFTLCQGSTHLLIFQNFLACMTIWVSDFMFFCQIVQILPFLTKFHPQNKFFIANIAVWAKIFPNRTYFQSLQGFDSSTCLLFHASLSILHVYLALHVYQFSTNFPSYTFISPYTCIRNPRVNKQTEKCKPPMLFFFVSRTKESKGHHKFYICQVTQISKITKPLYQI